ncbi:polysaccharide biosynthesis/export family protein [Sphingomonas japonica]|nr:polysaccharide biosynthesis/export family protein [Sphingomonas japonica]
MLAATVGACSSVAPNLPRGASAYSVIPAASGTDTTRNYEIGPLDVLQVTVFQEPDLSFDELQVDAAGNLLFPLIGDVRATGKTARDLSLEIAQRLGERYLVNPQVSVLIRSSVSQRVTVEGNVTEPGVYDIRGTSTLLEALARAKSPTRVAKLDEVVVFRVIDGTRMGAVFDVKAIREGEADDPVLLGGDTVVVGFDSVKGAFRDFLTTAPFFAVFSRF